MPYPTSKNDDFEHQNGQILKWVGAVSKWGQTDDIFVNVMTYTLAQIHLRKVQQKNLQNFVLNSHVSSEDTRRVLHTFSNQGKKSGVSLLVPNPGLLGRDGRSVAALRVTAARAQRDGGVLLFGCGKWL